MKKYLFRVVIGVAVLFGFNSGKAQYVTIPDMVFVNWLNANGYAGCMNGSQLDTTCPAVLNATTMNCSATPIRDLTGLQYFRNLTSIDCSNDSLYILPSLPASLIDLNCKHNNLSNLPVLPLSLGNLLCGYNRILRLPSLPPGLSGLYCEYNMIDSLAALPAGLTWLTCDYNQLPALPAIPISLTGLSCAGNQISVIPNLPETFYILVCYDNLITSLPVLPDNLTDLLCDENLLTSLPLLPSTLTNLRCSVNQLHSLPALPANLNSLECFSNYLSVLPELPASLQVLVCSTNQLAGLPALPTGLTTLNCGENYINSLPHLPSSLTDLTCDNNQLSSIPPLPDSLYYFYCYNNHNLACLPELKRIVNLNFDSTAVTCLPGYGRVTNSIPPLSSVPLCGIFNPAGCTPFWNISGQCYYDQNNDCSFDSVDVGTDYVKTQLYQAGVLVQQTFSGGEGYFSFDEVPNGNYTVQVDTSNLPFVVSCPNGNDYQVSLSAADSLSYSNNFAFKCRTQGFDLGVQSVLNSSDIPRPNAVISMNTIAGDISELYGAHCASGISGQVQIVYSGPVTYLNPATGALTPTISGDTLIYTIADWGAVNDYNAFNTIFRVNVNAVAGTPVCFTVTVTPITGDYNPTNNTLNYCFNVVNALDPNEKEVYPTQITAEGERLTYTIRFQNTGTAPAQNIVVTDTLSSNLNISSFQLLAFSAKNTTQISGNVVKFNFPNINLPDSLTSNSASRGYVQYRVKTNSSLTQHETVSNTAYIYFDLNPAVVTNTVVDTVTANLVAITQLNQDNSINIYPNPTSGAVTIAIDQTMTGATLNVTDLTGRVLLTTQLQTTNYQLQTSNLATGVYFLQLTAEGRRVVKELVRE